MDPTINRFQLQELIGSGSWSVVRRALDTSTNSNVAVKIEQGIKPEKSMLLREVKVLKHLQGLPGIPQLIASGSTDSYNYAAMELLKFNLEELYHTGKLSAMDVMFKAEALLDSLEAVHSRHIVHQDLKPKNLMDKDGKTYLIDFGLATKVKNVPSHAPSSKGILGTPSFASLAALLGMRQFPKDDLESLGYVIVWLLRGKLPWESYVEQSNLSGLKTMKFHASVRSICQDCPDEMAHYFNYIKGVRENEKPDYGHLKELMVNAHRKITYSKLAASPIVEKRSRLRHERSEELITVSSRKASNLQSRSLLNSPAFGSRLSHIGSRGSHDKLNSSRLKDPTPTAKNTVDFSICSLADLSNFNKVAFNSDLSLNFKNKGDSSHKKNSNDLKLDESKMTDRASRASGELKEARKRSSNRLKTITELQGLVQAEFSDSLPKTVHEIGNTSELQMSNGQEYIETEVAQEFPKLTRKLKRRKKPRAVKASNPRKSLCTIA